LEFKEAIFTFLKNIPKYEEELKSLLVKNFHIINP
jgi:hypothetical protein